MLRRGRDYSPPRRSRLREQRTPVPRNIRSPDIMAAQIRPEHNTGPRRPKQTSLATELEKLASSRDRGLISVEQHAAEKAKLLTDNDR